MFREYLLAYQVEQDFEAWDERLMNAFRLKVFALDQDLRKTKHNSPEQASTAVQSMVEATAEAVAAQGNSPSPHLVTSRDLRSAKRRKIDTVDTIDDKVVPKRECLIKTEVNDSMEALYNASPPPSYQRPSAVHPPISTLSVRDTRKTPLLKNEVESLENISGTPPLQLTIAQLEQYLEQSPSTNMRRLRRNLTECTERHGSASEVANIELGKLISALEKHNVLDKDTTTRLEAVVEYFEEEFEEWESSTMRDQASALRGFMDSIHTATLELLGAWNSATESFERYVEVLAEKEKWEREVETAKLLDADFRDI
ncbi:hypothetical protein BKA64DRAFT_721134 [Cadophora sp. MPI-SDFR-AT-0126]|nr:hypothetical protein BKA64DRAFT_721134 [Leotiomycetes sp. MPI-SDFR-AT-0126]